MKHLFVPYEIALALKEKGFEEECLAYFLTSTQPDPVITVCNPNKQYPEWINTISAPLYQQVVDWFREKHKIHFDICYERTSKQYYGHLFKESNNNRVDFSGKDYYKAIFS